MVAGFGWGALAILFGYLALFGWGNTVSGQAADKPVWLFHRATGRDRLAATGFCAAFGLAFFGPLIWLVLPRLHKIDPFWTEGQVAVLGIIGMFIASVGAMVAFAAQMSMGASWRVGVSEDAIGELVDGGLYQFSRNPTFVGQFVLLTGIALAIPAIPTFMARLLFLWSAKTQVRSEEASLQLALGLEYQRYAASVPRWIGLRRRGIPKDAQALH
ncbi:Protein-S-isoprenylcysteine O-methyltransferase Ste14 [Loktanella atrilutea]|uniref:Protein-S-isoprenylcysteine O-methyltransferase Ste14 n=1 Tax=Loktanella atrilutea TaxID=366533 RepID=A0A1M5FE27_LOKAT|nr:methyltransferase [Loktanella atrilutea]SHF89678.1 Protein-S-isoprenylcysteine O-methyltransferase Ste14 [Loktanella atrilutea]